MHMCADVHFAQGKKTRSDIKSYNTHTKHKNATFLQTDWHLKANLSIKMR